MMRSAKYAVGCLVLAAQAACASAACAQTPAAEARVADRELESWVERRVAAWQPTADERRFDRIGWARDIRDAERLAREHGRPIFLFTYSGRSIALKRC